MRGQALPGDAPARRCGPAAGHDTISTTRPTARPAAPLEQQQQARRLAEAGAKEVERIKAALEPRKPPAETKPCPKDARKVWLRAGLQQMRRGV